jgi:beta-lactamase class A
MAAGLASRHAAAESRVETDLARVCDDQERVHGGRLGVSVLGIASKGRIDHRANERFPMCSTFKLLAAALVLTRVDRKEETLDRRLIYSREKLVKYSPVTAKYAGDAGMTLGDICEAALTLSDNTAGNLMLESFGGPAQLTNYARSLGDRVTRVDRIEPELNEAAPGDPRDTTSPAAMVENLRLLIEGNALSSRSRDQLTRWLVANRTGDKRIRAGVPKGWRVGDKTGSGGNATTNDIAIIWPPEGGTIIITAYFTESSASDDARNAVFSDLAKAVVRR